MEKEIKHVLMDIIMKLKLFFFLHVYNYYSGSSGNLESTTAVLLIGFGSLDLLAFVLLVLLVIVLLALYRRNKLLRATSRG